MRPELLFALSQRRESIHARWSALLRTSRAATPLANPDTLVHLLDWTIDEIYRALREFDPAAESVPAEAPALACADRHNPYFPFFVAGEQAWQEALVLVQAATPGLTPNERDTALRELNFLYRTFAREEIHAFGAVCQSHDDPAPAHADALAAGV